MNIRKLVHRVGMTIVAGLAIVIGLLLVLTVAVPAIAGATTYTVLTRSMEPNLPPGTLLVVRPSAADSLHVGDVVTYQLHSGRPEVVSHRIVRVEASSDGTKRYITRGDANAVADATPVRPEQVKGKVWYAVPAIGWIAVVRDSSTLQPWLLGVGALLILYAAVTILSWVRKRQRGAPPQSTHRHAMSTPR